MTLQSLFQLYVCCINGITYVLFKLDKRKAKKGAHRISEQTLLLLAVFGGSVGAMLGMFGREKHKTKKWRFSIGIPMILLLQLTFVCYFLFKVRL